MADDTRLAEACLLLNYSSQSYREHMHMCQQSSKQQQQPSQELQPQQNQSIKTELNDTGSSQCCYTSSTTNESAQHFEASDPSLSIKQQVVEQSATHHIKLETQSNLTDNNNLAAKFTNVTSHRDAYLANETIVQQQQHQDHDYVDLGPLNSLLAAVNCALPECRNLTSKPGISQQQQPRQQSNDCMGSRSTSASSSMSDHNYCQQNVNKIPSSPQSWRRELGDAVSDLKTTSNLPSSYEFGHQVTVEESPGLISDITTSRSSVEFFTTKRKSDINMTANDVNIQYTNTTQQHLPQQRPLKLVAVHLGAANSVSDKSELLNYAKSICEEIMLQDTGTHFTPTLRKKKRKVNKCLKMLDGVAQRVECRSCPCDEQKLTAESAVVQLIKRMEDHQGLNCGYGSNLNIKGQVECDASLMCDKSQIWAGVGAVSGCKNPILLVKSLYDHSTIPRPLGLIQPNILVGSGAKQWMREHCPHLSIVDSKMVSGKAFNKYQKLKSRYDAIMRASESDNNSVEDLQPTLPSGLGHSGECSSKDQTVWHRQSPSSFGESCSPASELANSGEHVCSSPTKLDHGFYCTPTGQNLQKAARFAQAVRNQASVKKNLSTSDNKNKTKAPNHRIHTPGAATGVDYCCEQQVNLEEDEDDEDDYSDSERFDTVGAVAVDCDNNFASAISSGGLLLKYKGRLGQAAVPGAGCWCEDSVAVTTTGVGEYLTLSLFAKKFHQKITTLRLLFDLGHLEKTEDMSGLISCGIEECFEDLLRSPALAHVGHHQRLAGMLSVSAVDRMPNGSPQHPQQASRPGSSLDRAGLNLGPQSVDEAMGANVSPTCATVQQQDGDDTDLYLSYAHNTNSMCVGYMTCNDTQASSVMSSKLSKSHEHEIVVQTLKFRPHSNQSSMIGDQPNSLYATIQQPYTNATSRPGDSDDKRYQ